MWTYHEGESPNCPTTSGSGEFWYLSCGDGQSIGHWVFPSLQRRGGRAIKKKNPFRYGTAGVVAHKSRCSIRFETWCVSDHPVCAASERELFLNGAATPPVPGGEHPRLQIFKRPHYQLSESLATLPHFGKIRCSKIHKKPGGLWLRFTPFTRTLSCPNKFSAKTT